MDGVNVSVLAASAVDLSFEHRSFKPKTMQLVFVALRGKNIEK